MHQFVLLCWILAGFKPEVHRTVVAPSKDGLIYRVKSGAHSKLWITVGRGYTVKLPFESVQRFSMTQGAELLCASSIRGQLAFVDFKRKTVTTRKLEDFFAPDDLTPDRRSTIARSEYSYCLNSLADTLYVEFTDPIEVWAISLRTSKSHLVIGLSELERHVGHHLDWGEGGILPEAIQVSETGRLAIMLPGKPFGTIGQVNSLTYTFDPKSRQLRLCGEGYPVLWEGASRLLVSDLLFHKRWSATSEAGRCRLELIDYAQGVHRKVWGYNSAVFDGRNLLLVPRVWSNDTRPISKLQGYSADLKRRLAYTHLLSPPMNSSTLPNIATVSLP